MLLDSLQDCLATYTDGVNLFFHVQFWVPGIAKDFTHDNDLMFDSPIVTETLSTNFALRWNATTDGGCLVGRFEQFTFYAKQMFRAVVTHLFRNLRYSW